ncbi:MAG: pyridoxal-dependent decarboxylase, partial [Chloroflexota bacterium]
MNDILRSDADNLREILNRALEAASQFLQTLPDRPVGVPLMAIEPSALPSNGLGADQTLELFNRNYAAGLTGSSGPRYWGFVTGGSTPAALVGDWLASAFDQNATGRSEPAATQIEREAISLLRQLFGLSEGHAGSFVTGATMANFVGLALARQWAAHQQGVNLSDSGLYALRPIKILSGAPHSSIYKALSMLGLGKHQMQIMPPLPEREAVDVAELRRALQDLNEPCIVVGNAGTVNTVDFDDLQGLSALKQEFNFWLHVDAAFGGFAACSPRYRHLIAGIEAA